jgi:hypothetical protein
VRGTSGRFRALVKGVVVRKASDSQGERVHGFPIIFAALLIGRVKQDLEDDAVQLGLLAVRACAPIVLLRPRLCGPDPLAAGEPVESDSIPLEAHLLFDIESLPGLAMPSSRRNYESFSAPQQR